jgi:tetratricopeptide (TPR) repeat protein
MFCTICASVNSSAAERCAMCGAGLVQPLGLWDRPPRTQGQERRAGRLRCTIGRALMIVPVILLLSSGVTVAARYRTERAALADAYHRAERALATGDYDAAIAYFAQAGTYRDAAARRATTQAELAPYRDAYYDGAAALEAGRYDEAIASLLPVARALPKYEDVLALLDDACTGRNADLARDADLAVARHDWLTADRLLSDLLAADPGNTALAERLAALRRDHAPILFTRDSSLYTIGPDLVDERLITDRFTVAAPAWSPDRSRIAFYVPDPEHLGLALLYVIDADGANPRQLAARALVDWWPLWSPDGARIAFTSAAGFNVGEERGKTSIHVVDLATGVETDLTSGRFSDVTSATWSPTGDRIAFVSLRIYNAVGLGNVRNREGEVFIADVATGQMTSITEDRLLGAARVAWSPAEDRLLVLTVEGSSAWYEYPRTAIHLIDLASGATELMTPRTQTVGPPYWSPDGTRFAYVEGNTEQGNALLRVRWLTGRREAGIGIARPTTDMITWSPDGTALIVMARDPALGSTLVPLGDGPSAQVNLPIAFDLQPSLGPLQWSAFTMSAPPQSPCAGDPTAPTTATGTNED